MEFLLRISSVIETTKEKNAAASKKIIQTQSVWSFILVCVWKKMAGAAVEEPAITYIAGTVFPKGEAGGRMSSVPEALLQKMKAFQVSQERNVAICKEGQYDSWF